MGKITTLAEILLMRPNLRRDRKKLVCTNGCFDLLHRGHLQSLTQAANAGDVLLVLVNADSSVQSLKSPDRPFVGEDDRAALLAALAPVDFVVIFPDRRCDRILAAIEPDVYVKSADYTLATLDPAERAAVENSGGKIVFTPLVAGLSTSNLVKKIRRADPEKITAAAFSFIKNPAGEILLVCNRYDDEIRWGLPGGGQIRGESLTAAAGREAREETGLDIRIDGYVGLLERINPRIHLHCHQFAATVVGGELRIDPREEHVIDAAYFSAAKIRDWREHIMGREYLRRYAENAATYPRYVQMGENEE